jgi:coenzyme F420-0:L-glutamate ligase / coenzyme F420-1:gamma-L-glutamate ligase
LTSAVRIVAVPGLGEIRPGNDLVALIANAASAAAIPVEAGDVFVVTQKIVSKAEGALVDLDSIVPSERARTWADRWDKDPRVIELVLQQSARIVRMERGVIIAETRHGFVCANAGVDTSNVDGRFAALLPADPDASARRLCLGLCARFEVPIGVVVSDTFGRPWREGQVNVAVGVAGLLPITDYRGQADTFGRRLTASAIAVADELAAAAELVMGKTGNVPVAIVKGTGLGTGREGDGDARALIRRPEEDMFR